LVQNLIILVKENVRLDSCKCASRCHESGRCSRTLRSRNFKLANSSVLLMVALNTY